MSSLKVENLGEHFKRSSLMIMQTTRILGRNEDLDIRFSVRLALRCQIKSVSRSFMVIQGKDSGKNKKRSNFEAYFKKSINQNKGFDVSLKNQVGKKSVSCKTLENNF